MTEPSASSGGRLHGLDALRGIAAACVVLMHAHVLYPETPDLSPRAYLAVDFFFALSGFVMARTYEPRLRAGLPWHHFLRARYRRLWPTMFLGGILFLPFLREATADPDPHWLQQVLPNLLLLPSPLSENLFPLNAPAWSIFFELVANLLHGLVLWRFGLRGVLLTAALSGLALAFLASIAGTLDIGSDHSELLAGLVRVGLTYSLGIVLWRLRAHRLVCKWLVIPSVIAMPLLFTLAPVEQIANWAVDMAFVLFLVPVIMVGGLSFTGKARWAQLSGELSFPLYATHYPVLYWCRDHGTSSSMAILACLGVAALVALAPRLWKSGRPATS